MTEAQEKRLEEIRTMAAVKHALGIDDIHRDLLAMVDEPREELGGMKPAGPDWTCACCGSREGFKTITNYVPGEPTDYDMECKACGGNDIRESPTEAALALGEKLEDLEHRHGESPWACCVDMEHERDSLRARIVEFKVRANEAENGRESFMLECDSLMAQADESARERTAIGKQCDLLSSENQALRAKVSELRVALLRSRVLNIVDGALHNGEGKS